MENKKQKILVLSDLKPSASAILKSTVSFAKMIDGEIDFFHVKKATDAIERESQLTAVRSLKDQFISISNKIKEIILPISKEYGVSIDYKLSFGNIKTEIGDYINKSKPDIIVLGKRKSTPIKLDRDSITNFVLNKFKGSVLLVSDKNQLEPNKLLSLGLLNNTEKCINVAFSESLMRNTQKPLKSFSFVKSISLDNISKSSDNKMIEFLFEEGDNSIGNLSRYISKNNINLLCLDRGKKKTSSNKTNFNEMINKLNVSLLLTAKQNFAVK